MRPATRHAAAIASEPAHRVLMVTSTDAGSAVWRLGGSGWARAAVAAGGISSATAAAAAPACSLQAAGPPAPQHLGRGHPFPCRRTCARRGRLLQPGSTFPVRSSSRRGRTIWSRSRLKKGRSRKDPHLCRRRWRWRWYRHLRSPFAIGVGRSLRMVQHVRTVWTGQTRRAARNAGMLYDFDGRDAWRSKRRTQGRTPFS